jgi:hypothetical protein
MKIDLSAETPQSTPGTRFVKRFILPSDNHPFVGRIYDLSIVAYHFESYEKLASNADCKYAFDVNGELSSLTRRVESLNLVGGMLWPDPMPRDFKEFPVSRYEWLTVIADAFLMRYISVVDCALLLTNEVFEAGLERRNCSMGSLRKRGVPQCVLAVLERLKADQGSLRDERNARFHHGLERNFTSDDVTFRTAALFEQWGRSLRGHGQDGRRVNVERSFREGLVGLQREFNGAARKLTSELNRLYDELGSEFESRFVPRFRVGPFGPGKLRD